MTGLEARRQEDTTSHSKWVLIPDRARGRHRPGQGRTSKATVYRSLVCPGG